MVPTAEDSLKKAGQLGRRIYANEAENPGGKDDRQESHGWLVNRSMS